MRSELEQLALDGQGYERILRRLAEVTGRMARLVAVHGGLLATSESSVSTPAASAPASGVPASASTDRGLEPADAQHVLASDTITRVTCTDGLVARSMPVRAGSRRVGILLVAEPTDDAVLQAAVVPIAIEAVRRDAEAAATAESASRLIDELRFGSLRDTAQLTRAAERFGLLLDKPHAAAVFAYDGPHRRAWSTAIRWIEMPVREERDCGWTVLTGEIERELRRIRDRLQGIVGDGVVLAATGPPVTDAASTPRSFREAEIVLALLRREPDALVLPYDALGVRSLLISVPPARLSSFVGATLGRLLDRPELLETLESWFACRGSRAGVAARLGIHRNSVGYRVARVRELLGVDPLDPWHARRLQTALDARAVLQALVDLGHA